MQHICCDSGGKFSIIIRKPKLPKAVQERTAPRVDSRDETIELKEAKAVHKPFQLVNCGISI